MPMIVKRKLLVTILSVRNPQTVKTMTTQGKFSFAVNSTKLFKSFLHKLSFPTPFVGPGLYHTIFHLSTTFPAFLIMTTLSQVPYSIPCFHSVSYIIKYLFSFVSRRLVTFGDIFIFKM